MFLFREKIPVRNVSPVSGCCLKSTPNGIMLKAWLVEKRFEELWKIFKKDSPTWDCWSLELTMTFFRHQKLNFCHDELWIKRFMWNRWDKQIFMIDDDFLSGDFLSICTISQISHNWKWYCCVTNGFHHVLLIWFNWLPATSISLSC